jgi:hypothetical protein
MANKFGNLLLTRGLISCKEFISETFLLKMPSQEVDYKAIVLLHGPLHAVVTIRITRLHMQ